MFLSRVESEMCLLREEDCFPGTELNITMRWNAVQLIDGRVFGKREHYEEEFNVLFHCTYAVVRGAGFLAAIA